MDKLADLVSERMMKRVSKSFDISSILFIFFLFCAFHGAPEGYS